MRTFQTKKLDEAISLALAHVEPITESESIPTTDSFGRVLAEDILCPEDLPGFARSAMDGYAVRAQDTAGASREHPVTLRIIGSVEMGQDPRTLPDLLPGEACEIPTGGPMPPSADAVIMLEETARQNNDVVQLFSAVTPGTHVLAADSDFRRGELVFKAGHKLRAVDIGALLAMGILSVRVYRRVRVGIISTGSELVEAHEKIRLGQVRQINSHILRGLIESQSAQSLFFGIVPDEREKIRAAVQHAVSESDMVLLSGGSSVGARDWTLQILQDLGQVFVHGLQIRPGKPTICAIIERKPVMGLPGNPVSCALVFEKFVRPVLARRSGLKVLLPSHRLASAQLIQTVRSAVGREDFVAVRVRIDEADGTLYAEPILGHSHNISTLARADGIVRIPAELEEIPEGAQVWVELL
ncbi:MAG: molybdopterin molybdotransferase MoeA [Candidatus Bipolaricaulota bacterium]|nr:molybdopterin molybdotransferase MoeA [Candidatus Bipolaricaulota bacterium]